MIKSKAVFLFIAAVVIIPVSISAQLNHFIYLQTEGKQPFYAKLDKRVMSSSVSGYLIIPKLKNGTYNITVGFPKQDKSEQTYTCAINDKDAGYLIKNFGENGWGLFNLQTLDVTMAAAKKNSGLSTTEKADDFSTMLSEVTNDPSVKKVEKTPVQDKEKQPVKLEEKPVVNEGPKSSVIKKQATATPSGFEITYIDYSGVKYDTIQVFIPAEAKGETQAKEPSISRAIETQEQENKKIEIKEDKKFLPIKVKASPAADTVTSTSAIGMVNSDCKAYASEEDFLKLRKKMAGESKVEAMLSIARKFFKSKCYTTEQVKNLSALFLNDEGKYQFFDLAYHHVSDSSSFSTLQNQLTDAYYLSRFKAMVTH